MSSQKTDDPFHKSLYERFTLYEFVEPVLNCNEFLALRIFVKRGPDTRC